ncbi:putative baseplate assembly protein [Leptolyngbyaceae cyanobacterium UHCC 1019]
MPIPIPSLDDRNFEDLVEELIARIPAHTPEWTNPRSGDPGRTLLELFAWLGDTLLYRANLIPERQRLAFLRLLGVPLRPAVPAQGIVSLAINDTITTASSTLQPYVTIKGSVNFETRSEITVFPVTAIAYHKAPLTHAEQAKYANVVTGLQQIYQLPPGAAAPYFTKPVFANGQPDIAGFDIVQKTLDHSLWVALLAPKLESDVVRQVRETLGTNPTGGQPLLNVGVVPTIAFADEFEEIRSRIQIPFVWEISTGRTIAGNPQYIPLRVVADSSAGLTRQGVMRLALPATSQIGVPSNDVRTSEGLMAGTGDSPPRIDTPQIANRLVAWLRLRPTRLDTLSLSLSWVGINAVEIDQRQTLTARVIGTSDGSADQVFALPDTSVELATLQIEVEEPDQGWQPWSAIEDLALAGREITNGSVYQPDSEAGTIRFGDSLRGRIPGTGRRIRVAFMRSGGGTSGNLPPGHLTEVATAKLLDGKPPTAKLKVVQPLATDGGSDAETLTEAERRIPDLFRHRDRAVTEDDYRRLVATAPGIRVGRVEILPRFKPQQRRMGVPGVISVMVLPQQGSTEPPNPRPDRLLLETIHAYLDSRRPLATELYVIGCDYQPLGISVAVQIQDGFGQDSVLVDVREALRRFLWSLPSGGSQGKGWQLGRAVSDRELEVIVARVPGISTVEELYLFRKQQGHGDWQLIKANGKVASLTLAPWQLPELLAVVAVVGSAAPKTLVPSSTGNGTWNGTVPGANDAGAGGSDNGTGTTSVAVPVVPEVC